MSEEVTNVIQSNRTAPIAAYSSEWNLPLYVFTVTVVLPQQYSPVPIALTPAT